MALTIFPIILFNSSAGSDTAASGAGPATAITGTCAASTASTTVTFNASPDLSGVAQDGSHVLWVTGIGFVRISTVDNTAKTCVVETALTIGAGTAFAIGGKRATLDNAESRRLFAATSSPTASGIGNWWTIQVEDNQSITSVITVAAAAVFTIRGDSESSRRTITQTANANAFNHSVANQASYQNFVFLNSNATKSVAVSAANSAIINMRNCIAGANDGTNCPAGLFFRSSGTPHFSAVNCAAILCGGTAIANQGPTYVEGCDISRCAAGISQTNNGNPLIVRDSIVCHNTGDGITCNQTGYTGISIENSTIDGNGGDGIELTGNSCLFGVRIAGCNITNNSGTGLKFSGTAPHVPTVQYNNFYGNGTASSGFTLDATNLTADPGYTDRTNTVRNYAVGTAMKAAGFPASTATIGAGQSGTTSYVDIGAAQRQEAGSGGYSRSGRGTIR